MLGLHADRAFVVDEEFEFDAPTFCDLWLAERRSDSFDTDSWFSVPHPLHAPLEPQPPAEPLLDPRECSPYRSPASKWRHPGTPSADSWSKVSPGPQRMLASSTKKPNGGLGLSARKRSPASPIAIGSLHGSPPRPTTGAPVTPARRAPDSAARIRTMRTPASANKLTGAQRVPAAGGAGGVAQRMQFDAIDETTTSPPPPAPRPRATRVSTALHLAPPTLNAVHTESHVAAPAAKAVRRGVKSTAAGTTTTSSGPLTRKRRSADAQPLLDLDPELEAMLSKHNRAVASTTTTTTSHTHTTSTAAAVTHSHLPTSPAAVSAGARKTPPVVPGSGNKAPKKKMRVGVAAPSMIASASAFHSASNSATSTSSVHSPPTFTHGVAAPTTATTSSSAAATAAASAAAARVAARKAALRKSASLAGLSRKSVAPPTTVASTASPTSRTSPPSRRVTRARVSSSSTISSANNTPPSRAATTARPAADLNVSQVMADTDVSLTGDEEHTGSTGDEEGVESDISFNVEDLDLPEETPAPPPLGRVRKSLGRALRSSVGHALASTPASPPQHHAVVTDNDEDMLDALIVLDEPRVEPVAPVAPRRIQAAVQFTAAATVAPRTTSRPTTATTTRKSVGHVLAPRNMNVASGAMTSRGVAAKAAASKTSASTKKPSSASAALTSLAARATSARSTTRSTTATATPAAPVPVHPGEVVDDEIAAMLAAHNTQIKSSSGGGGASARVRFVPRQHSAANLKRWEATHGKKWHQLTSDEKEYANLQISAMIAHA